MVYNPSLSIHEFQTGSDSKVGGFANNVQDMDNPLHGIFVMKRRFWDNQLFIQFNPVNE